MRILSLLALVLSAFSALALKPQVYFNYGTFHMPKKQPYIETYLSVIGNSIVHKPSKTGFVKGEVEIIMLFKQEEKIIDFKKYTLTGPDNPDTLKSFPNFIDQQRFSLPNGKYEYELKITDLNSKEAPIIYNDTIELLYSDNEILISDIGFIESYTKTTTPNILSKSGYDLVPYISNYYPQSMNSLVFYAEIYNTFKVLGADEKFLVSSFIEVVESGVRLNNFTSFSRKNSSDVVVIFSEIPIEKLPSGNYNLVIETKNKNNEVLTSKKVFFQRVNPTAEIDFNDLASISVENTFVMLISPDSIDEYIKMIRPISSRIEQVYADNQLKSSEIKLKQQFFYNFWYNRQNINPELAWIKYRAEVAKAQTAYSTKIKKGYETDRGRIFLKYGPANAISQRYNEPSSYPYEIWHYHKIGNFSNRRFIFYNPDLVTNDFELLHSDMFGEIQNPRWQVVLNKRNTQVFDLYDDKAGKNQYGSEADDLFIMPR
jgi:GWxTD domain-containing protein